MEQGKSKSLKEAAIRANIAEVKRKIIFLDKEPVTDLIVRLEKHKSPQFVFIDSLQYSGITYRQHIEMTNRFRNKMFIYIVQARGKNPYGRVAEQIEFDADIKIFVHGFYIQGQNSRYGGNKPFIVDHMKAAEYGYII